MNEVNNSARIDGHALARELRERVRRDVETMAADHGITPRLAIVHVGSDPASRAYVRGKHDQAAAAGMASYAYHLPVTTSETALLAFIRRLNDDPQINGILVQSPLPRHISGPAVEAAIDPDKDVDGFHAVNIGRLWCDQDGLVPCTAKACRLLIKHAVGADLSGRHAVVIGCSGTVGRPLANLLLRAGCTTTLAHEQTPNLPALCYSADIVVAALGLPRRVRGHWVRRGATVIDAGATRGVDGLSGKTRWIGDVAFDEVSHVAHALTPVPGGVGPLSLACLLDNTVLATRRQYSLSDPAQAWGMQAQAAGWQMVEPMRETVEPAARPASLAAASDIAANGESHALF